jgi:hypothetical protein
MTSDITYEDKIGQMLIDLPLDGVFDLSDKVAPENRHKFIQCVKDYIDRSLGNKEGWTILFNNNYTKLRKDIYTLTKTK